MHSVLNGQAILLLPVDVRDFAPRKPTQLLFWLLISHYCNGDFHTFKPGGGTLIPPSVANCIKGLEEEHIYFILNEHQPLAITTVA